MIELSQEPAFILKRTPYREHHCFLDFFCKQQGIIRAVSRITSKKPQTHLNPFTRLSISGQKKHALANIYQIEIERQFSISMPFWLHLCYLNELILSLHPQEEADPILFDSYQEALQAPSNEKLRAIEWHFIELFALFPERKTTSAYYQLYQQDGFFTLLPSSVGFSHDFIVSVENATPNYHDPQAKRYFQTLLQHYKKIKKTHRIAKEWYALLND